MNVTLPPFSNATMPAGGLNDSLDMCPADDTVSAGSAAFITIALIFGCMTQLPGSLTTGEGNRFWRISPFLCAAETGVIFVRVIGPLFNSVCTFVRRHLIPERSSWHLDRSERQGRSGLKTTAYAILAERLGSSRKYNYWLRQQWKTSAPTEEQIPALLDEVSNLERGSTLRPIVIIPMVLQFCKLMVVEASWFSVKLLPWIYWWSWFSVEFLLLMVHGDKLGERDMLEAERILLLSVAPTEIVSPKKRHRRADPETATPPPADSTSPANVDHASSTTPTPTPTPTPVHLESQTDPAKVGVQSRALLTRVVGKGNAPRNVISFRGGRTKLSTMQGKGSNMFYQMLIGLYALFFEAVCVGIFVISLLGDLLPVWLQLVFSIGMCLVFPVVFFDAFIGAIVASASRLWLRTPEHDQSGWRDWVSFRTMICILLYYTLVYSDAGTKKPQWLDWLG